MTWIKDIIGWFVKNTVNERVNDYRSSYLRNQDVLTQVTLEMDRALMTFSIASLAALAALNDKIFGTYGRLSFIALTCFVGVVVSVILSYYLSRGMLIDAQKIITRNYKKSLTKPLGEGMEKVKYATATKIVNGASLALFILGMICFVVLMALYIGGTGR
ncbi:MAG: hypothetical protein WCH58_03955 [Candidatus Saccharibacteria bacterium]